MTTLLRSVAATCLVAVAGAASAGPITPADRQRLVAHLEMTEAWLVSEVTGLSAAQLAFRPAPDAWSVKDVVEHLGIAEPQYWTQVLDSLKRPASGYTSETTDAGILWYGIDRTKRAVTGEARVPDGRFKTVDEALTSFRALRATMLDHARTTRRGSARPPARRRQHGRLPVVPDDLDARAAAHPADPRDQGGGRLSGALARYFFFGR